MSMENISKTKCRLFENINKIDKHLEILIKSQEKRKDTNKQCHEWNENIITVKVEDTKLREYYE